jgi:hypothetical protein
MPKLKDSLRLLPVGRKLYAVSDTTILETGRACWPVASNTILKLWDSLRLLPVGRKAYSISDTTTLETGYACLETGCACCGC